MGLPGGLKAEQLAAKIRQTEHDQAEILRLYQALAFNAGNGILNLTPGIEELKLQLVTGHEHMNDKGKIVAEPDLYYQPYVSISTIRNTRVAAPRTQAARVLLNPALGWQFGEPQIFESPYSVGFSKAAAMKDKALQQAIIISASPLLGRLGTAVTESYGLGIAEFSIARLSPTLGYINLLSAKLSTVHRLNEQDAFMVNIGYGASKSSASWEALGTTV